MIKTIIFDMDGVIVDSEPLFDSFLMDYCKNLGVSLTQTHLEAYRGKTSRSQWTDIINEFSLIHSVDELIVDARKSYLQYLEVKLIKPIPGITTLLRKLSRTYVLVLASSASPHRITLFLDKTRVRNFFQAIVSADDVIHGKPAPDVFLLAAKKVKAKPYECVVVEDATNGVQAAKNAKMKVIGYKGLLHNTQDLSMADAVIKNFKEVTPLFLKKL
ncbi:MAG: HAD family phosphatase [Candidatus Levybacteria bacterium]|nr:HAD family phosphatase [Candidatus Levybacteria bacterium]